MPRAQLATRERETIWLGPDASPVIDVLARVRARIERDRAAAAQPEAGANARRAS